MDSCLHLRGGSPDNVAKRQSSFIRTSGDQRMDKNFCANTVKLIASVIFVGLASVQPALPKAGDIVSADIANLYAGLFCDTVIVGRKSAPDMVTGEIDLFSTPPAYAMDTRVIEATLGNHFGVTLDMAPSSATKVVTVRITHPPFSDGPRTSIQTHTTILQPGMTSGFIYSFDFDYELAIGKWQLEALNGAEVVYRVAFDVVAPSDEIEGTANCDGLEAS